MRLKSLLTFKYLISDPPRIHPGVTLETEIFCSHRRVGLCNKTWRRRHSRHALPSQESWISDINIIDKKSNLDKHSLTEFLFIATAQGPHAPTSCVSPLPIRIYPYVYNRRSHMRLIPNTTVIHSLQTLKTNERSRRGHTVPLCSALVKTLFR